MTDTPERRYEVWDIGRGYHWESESEIARANNPYYRDHNGGDNPNPHPDDDMDL